MSQIEVTQGQSPLILSFPHTGTDLLPHMIENLRSPWLARKDADWWIHRLYDFAPELDITTVRTPLSRTVIDVNRDPTGVSLYPGQNTTELCPTTSFDNEPLYKPGHEPDQAEIEHRLNVGFWPYHHALRAEIERLKALHGYVILYDAHSIRSVMPRLFEGQLPIFNIGSFDQKSCDPTLSLRVLALVEGFGQSAVLNGRFKGGWTTRHYGQPKDHVHALQMELSIRGYMDEPETLDPETWPPAYDPERAAPMVHSLRQIFTLLIQLAPSLRRS